MGVVDPHHCSQRCYVAAINKDLATCFTISFMFPLETEPLTRKLRHMYGSLLQIVRVEGLFLPSPVGD
jgi:hypothetical protein